MYTWLGIERKWRKTETVVATGCWNCELFSFFWVLLLLSKCGFYNKFELEGSMRVCSLASKPHLEQAAVKQTGFLWRTVMWESCTWISVLTLMILRGDIGQSPNAINQTSHNFWRGLIIISTSWGCGVDGDSGVWQQLMDCSCCYFCCG